MSAPSNDEQLHDTRWQEVLSDDDFLSIVGNRLSPEEQRVKDILEQVKDVYVPCGRDRLAADIFSRFMTSILAKRNGRRDDGRALFLTGESGAGKTSVVRRMIEGNPTLAPIPMSYGLVTPMISITLMGPSTLKYLGLNILRKAGYEIKRKYEQGEVWDLLPEQLHLRKILIIHIDETQHMLKLAQSDRERENLAKAFKGVMNYDAWPVSFIMSGMPETVNLSRLDEQIERQSRFLALPDVSLPDERVLIEKIVTRMCKAAHLELGGTLQSDLPERIAHAARYRYGRIAQVVLAAIEQAILKDDGRLSRDHFALAYLDHSQARGHDEMNPFLVDDWERLEPGSFLIEDHRG